MCKCTIALASLPRKMYFPQQSSWHYAFILKNGANDRFIRLHGTFAGEILWAEKDSVPL